MEFKNFEDSRKHEWRKAAAKLCFSISVLVLIISFLMLGLALLN
ncbi:hypothetical protein KUC_0559 [Vreelandella boliviensis LC1]|uniref:Uncharacterized protein n=1 Tax=Vreelandella boliviensis LC1 TaxID=1072583 RepID=A0A7U9C2Y0_9GAMM|nr:hypothetical protein KUC_0559 [Halomonas boliviensis LC1]